MKNKMLDTTMLSDDLKRPFRALTAVLGRHESLMVAYSGGVDSGLLAWVASAVLGDRMIAVMGDSPSLARRERRAAIEFAASHDIPYRVIGTSEASDPNYRRNHADRCYFCKTELFSRLGRLAGELGFSRVAHGANTDDSNDHRPGAIAAREHGVVAPLVDAGLDKKTIRGIANAFGLSLWDKPAAPCLASRVPYFQEVTPRKLAQIEAAEDVLKDLGFRVCRVRHHGPEARVEVPADDRERILHDEVWSRVVEGITEAGFETVALEAGGFRSGRLNEGLPRSG